MKPKPKVGQILYMPNNGVLQETTVIKVGRKYFYCDPGRYGSEDKFHLETWRRVGSFNVALYASRQTYEEDQEADSIFRELSGIFSYSRGDKFSLDQLKRIEAIIEEEK